MSKCKFEQIKFVYCKDLQRNIIRINLLYSLTYLDFYHCLSLMKWATIEASNRFDWGMRIRRASKRTSSLHAMSKEYHDVKH